MTPDDLATARLAELRSSAKGWHGVQLAALGFIGLCGVIKPGDSSNPEALQALSGIIILVAFFCACLGIYYVAKAAWPIYGADPAPMADADQAAISIASAQLRRGLILTFLSIALTALATTSSWWPEEVAGGAGGGASGGANVEVQASGGQTVCGELAEGPQGALRVLTIEQPVELQLSQVASVRPVDSC
jgi:hypothetical protein